MKKILLFIAVLTIPNALFARPISYPEGWTVMQMNDANSNAFHLHYSPTIKYSIGYKHEYWRDAKWRFNGAQLNYLVKRFNKPKSQANIYLKNGLGVAYSDHGKFVNETSEAAFSELAMDWEDRRLFVSYSARGTYAGDIDKFAMQKARVGVAPYIGDYGDLHSWIMLELEHNPEAKGDEVTLTPLLRFFKDVYLFEVGANEDGKVTFNTIIRF